VTQTIREALAKGADRAIHIETAEADSSDPLQLARMLARALESEKPDLVLTGLQSDDFGYGQTGVVLAEVMDLPHATIVMSIDLDGSAIRVKRELEDGWFQHVRLPLPALLTVQSGATRLRYATLMGIKKAKSKEVRKLAAADLRPPSTSSVRLDRVYMPEKTKRSRIFEGPPKEAAAQLVESLRHEARVI
jgi:electron transfer flavoprotein beta subunit